MVIDEKLKRYIEKVKGIAEEMNCEINKAVLDRVVANGFKCLCKLNKECPCEECRDEIKRIGRCFCGLFVKKNEA
jgi:ferredoxin-thioredoxin reductase catalytic subunit